MKHRSWIPAALLFAALFCPPEKSIAADASTPFAGAKADWHGFDRYDFLLDER